MIPLNLVTPEEAGFDPARWDTAVSLLRNYCEHGELPSAGLIAGRRGSVVPPLLFGRQSTDGSQPVRPDAMFLIASITKPIVVAGALLLVERGLLTLSDKVIEYIPEFGRHGKNGVRIRHLMTHTSGLPDMLPENQELREKHAPLSAFVEGTCGVELSFPPGRGVQYQSMGLAVLGAIIERITGQSCAAFLRKEVFEPLGMTDSWLGLPADWFDGPEPKASRIADVQVPADLIGKDWNWNSRYWRMLGVPWGGMLTTPLDLARYCLMMLRPQAGGVLSPATIAASTRNQLEIMGEVPELERRTRPWGLGWRLNWPEHSANFGDLLGNRTYGHWGATGTVLWIDPDHDAFMVLLTTRPQEPHGTVLARVSNAVAAAIAR